MYASVIFQTYLSHILGISQPYLRHILGIHQAYIVHTSGISWKQAGMEPRPNQAEKVSLEPTNQVKTPSWSISSLYSYSIFILGTKKSYVQKSFGQRKFWVKRKYGSKENILSPNNFWDRSFVSGKMLDPKNFLT